MEKVAYVTGYDPEQRSRLSRQWGGRGLSVRAQNVLMNARIETDAELREIGWRGMRRWHNCGKTTIAEIGRTIFNEDWGPIYGNPEKPKPNPALASFSDDELRRELTTRARVSRREAGAQAA